MKSNTYGWLVLTAAVAMLTLASCGGGSGGTSGVQTPDPGSDVAETGPLPPPPEPTYKSPDRYINILGDRTILFTTPGEKMRIEAEVRRVTDDAVVEGATINYTSLEEAVATVDASGVVTAEGDKVASTTIVLSADDAFDVVASVAYAQLTDGTEYLASSQVGNYDPDAGTLTLSTTLAGERGLTEGSVIVSGDEAGLLVALKDNGTADPDAGTITYSVRDATLDEAVEALNVTVRGPRVRAVARLSEDGLTTYGLDSADGPTIVPAAIGGFECELEDGNPINVSIEGSYLDYDFDLAPVVNFQRDGFTVERLELYVEGDAYLDARSGTLTAPRLSGKATCERSFTSIPLAYIPIFGPIGVRGSVKPAFGFDISGSSASNNLTVTGPTLDVRLDMSAGMKYSSTNGFEPVSSFERSGNGLDWGNYSGNLDAAFDTTVEPYLKSTFAISPSAWGSLATFEMAEVKVGGKADLALTAPLDPLVRAYTGPQWTLSATGSGSLEPLLNDVQGGVQRVQPFLERLGIDADITDIDTSLFSFDTKLDESPTPKAEASTSTAPTHTMSLVADDAGSGSVRFVGFNVGDAGPSAVGTVVASADADGTHAHTRWTPGLTERGINELRARAYDEPFGSLGLPYAKDQGWVFSDVPVRNRAFVEKPTADRVSRGESFDNWVGLGEDEAPAGIDQIVVEWNDGDSVQSKTVNRSEHEGGWVGFRTDITTQFGRNGQQYQEFTLRTTDGTYIDDRNVPVLVGAAYPPATTDEPRMLLGNVYVSNQSGNNTNFVFAGTAEGDPDLAMYRGSTYRVVNATEPAVDFWFKYRNLPGEEHAIPNHISTAIDATRNGATSDRITLAVPEDAPDVLYYRSDMHPEMSGVIYVFDPPQ